MGNDPPALTPGARLVVEVLRSAEQLRGLSVRWNEALARSAVDSPFLTWEWVSAWLTAVAGAVDPEIYLVREEGGRVLGIAPFCVTRLSLLRSIPLRCLRFAGEPGVGGEYPDVILVRGAEAEAGAALADALGGRRSRWDCAWLPKAAGWTGAQERLSTIFGPRRFARRSRPCSFAMLPLPAPGTGFLETAPRNLRSGLRRARKQLESGSPVEFSCLRKPEDVLPLLDAFAALHQKRWERAGQPGAFQRRASLLPFFRELSRAASSRDWVRLCVLKQGGGVAAVQFGVVHNGVYYQLQEGYDPSSTPGLGNYLRWRSIEALMQEGVRSYDFMAGYSEHKRRWGAQERGGLDNFYVRRTARTLPVRLVPLWPGGRYLRAVGL